MKWIWLALFAVMAGSIGLAQAADRSVLLAPFENTSSEPDSSGLQEGIRELLAAHLNEGPDALRVLEREKLDALFAEKGLAWQDLTAGKPEIAAFIQANFIIKGSFRRIDGRVSVEAFLYEIETGRLVKAASSSALEADVRSACLEIASAFRRAAAEDSGGVHVEGDENPEATAWLIQGIGAFESKDYAKAFPAFLKIIQKNPDHASAAFWLAKTYDAAEMPDHAAASFRQFTEQHSSDSRVPEAENRIKELMEGNS